ncbi:MULTISPECIES: hypothetical protein [unclassified Streptomyces]|uniref:hypothetical protein n=1 Tax=unclassified Streptomyces TaxID=2593676 RepID=UPI0033223180
MADLVALPQSGELLAGAPQDAGQVGRIGEPAVRGAAGAAGVLRLVANSYIGPDGVGGLRGDPAVRRQGRAGLVGAVTR